MAESTLSKKLSTMKTYAAKGNGVFCVHVSFLILNISTAEKSAIVKTLFSILPMRFQERNQSSEKTNFQSWKNLKKKSKAFGL